ncbi:hypothetical protein BX600DRAFT_454413 [Xylariales sp. PMI_506]|nr:hypothetical protein BX600DRAFT_454413 [Xylariales sp. PMI_506]
MNILPSLAPPSSFQVGIRALSRHSARLLIRPLSTASRGLYPDRCSHNNSAPGHAGPLRVLRGSRGPYARQLLPRITVRTAFTFRAIVQYSNLPDSYEDAEGLDFRKEDLTQREVNEIFGSHLNARDANQLLRIIQGRRVAGTLDDPDLQQNTVKYMATDKIKALEYLRKNIPVDEIINAGLRAEDELRYLEEQEQEQIIKDGEEQFKETSPQSTPTASSAAIDETDSTPVSGRLPKAQEGPYGEGAFDRIRKRNEAKYAEQQKREEEERLKREEEEALQNIGTLQTEQAKPRELSPWRKKHMERATSDLAAPPEMKWWERLLPMTAMAVVIWGLCAAFAAFYTPPRRADRVWPEIPPAAATCMGLILANLIIFALWKAPPAWAFFNKYMLVVPATPRPLQLLGAMFSHQSFGHLAGNMVALWFFGIRLHDEIGRGNFLALYVSCGTLGFLSSMFNLVLFRGLSFTTLGASGSVYGIIAAYLWMHRFDEFKILGYPHDPWSGPNGLTFLSVIIGLHVYGMISTSAAAASLDVASHVGGIIAGVLGIEIVQKYMDERERRSQEQTKTLGALDEVLGKVMEPQPPSKDN